MCPCRVRWRPTDPHDEACAALPLRYPAPAESREERDRFAESVSAATDGRAAAVAPDLSVVGYYVGDVCPVFMYVRSC